MVRRFAQLEAQLFVRSSPVSGDTWRVFFPDRCYGGSIESQLLFAGVHIDGCSIMYSKPAVSSYSALEKSPPPTDYCVAFCIIPNPSWTIYDSAYMTHSLVQLTLRLASMAGEIIIYVAYGIDVLPENDPFVTLAQNAMQSLTMALVPGRFLVVSRLTKVRTM